MAEQDEEDKKGMNLNAQGRKLKIPEQKFGQESMANINAPLSLREKRSFSSAKKGTIGLSVGRIGSSRNKVDQGFNTIDPQHSEAMYSDAGSLPVISTKAGPIQLDKDCLTCASVPAHVMEMFRVACITYKPSAVYYRANKLSRKRLLKMRKTLLDKCEEMINNGGWSQ